MYAYTTFFLSLQGTINSKITSTFVTKCVLSSKSENVICSFVSDLGLKLLWHPDFKAEEQTMPYNLKETISVF